MIAADLRCPSITAFGSGAKRTGSVRERIVSSKRLGRLVISTK